MSIVIRKSSGNGSVMLCKANDMSAFDLINPEEKISRDRKIKKANKRIIKIWLSLFHSFKA